MSVQVPKGYKQTEVGVIPEDWECQILDELAKRGSGHTPNKKIPEYWNGSIKWISLRDSDVLDNLFIEDTALKISKKGLDNSSAVLHPAGTVVLSRDAGVGKSAIMKYEMAVSQHFMAWQCNSYLNNKFLYFYLQSKKNEFERIAMGSTIKTIGLPYFKELKIPKPSIEEQQAIAEALSDADALIESLEQLIAKKCQIKQGAMQDLLTGQRRLPGFSGEWGLKKLKDLGSTYGGLTGKTKFDFGEGSSHYITFMNVMSNVVVDDEIFELVNISENESQNRVMMGDLLFNGSSETPEELGFCSVVSKPLKNVYLNSFCFGFRFKEVNKSCGLYFAYFFRSKEGRELLKSLAQGATRYNLSKTSLLNLSFRIPSLDEQIAIADVLSELDAEVSMIQSRLSKARQIKQSMMQELLTGRIRLI